MNDQAKEPSITNKFAHMLTQIRAEQGYLIDLAADGGFIFRLKLKADGTPIDADTGLIIKGIAESVIKTGQAVITRNAMTDRSFASDRNVMRLRVRSVICVPLWREQQIVSLVYVEHRTKRGQFNRNQVPLLEGLVDQTAQKAEEAEEAEAQSPEALPASKSKSARPAPTPSPSPNTPHAGGRWGGELLPSRKLRREGLGVVVPEPVEGGRLPCGAKSPHSRYILHEELGQGGMGMVHRATDRLTGQIVALKQVRIPVEQLQFTSRLDTMTERNLRVALAQEFQIVAGLRHPHIISVLNYGFGASQQPYFTMSYLPEAQTVLEACMARDQAGKVQLIREMLQALAYLHRRGIIHRDLKPSNVLVAENHLRVLDFGLSISQETKLTSAGGTLLYMAPELLNQEAATQASDLYAVGVMAYQLFARRHPFDTTSYAFVDQVLNQVPDLTVLGLDEPLANVIARLLAKKPADRYLSAEACLRAIQAALGEAIPAESAAIRESYLQAATFVGREREMGQLQRALVEAKSGPGSVWLIGGESGVGKSRLIEEFRTHALVSGWQVLTGQAVAEGGHPYQLWRHIIPSLVLNTELTDLEAGVLKQIAPTIDRLLGRDIPLPPEISGEAGQQRLILTIMSILQRQPQPLLLLLEDLQWAQRSLAPLKHMLNKFEKTERVM
ncbi:MAG: protein kinase domain-containing protein, partial [Ardenticatenaceae bacterium]